MSKQIARLMVVIFFSVFAVSIANVANANTYYHGKHCRYIPAHHAHGVWYPAHKECWVYKSHCRWVGGHYRHGVWYPKHKVCY